MTAVDPFVLQIPSAFGRDPSTWTIHDSNEMLSYFEYLGRWAHQMTIRSGGANDNLGDVVGVIGGEPDAALPDGNDPVWEDPGWVFWAGS